MLKGMFYMRMAAGMCMHNLTRVAEGRIMLNASRDKNGGQDCSVGGLLCDPPDL